MCNVRSFKGYRETVSYSEHCNAGEVEIVEVIVSVSVSVSVVVEYGAVPYITVHTLQSTSPPCSVVQHNIRNKSIYKKKKTSYKTNHTARTQHDHVSTVPATHREHNCIFLIRFTGGRVSPKLTFSKL